MIFAVNLTCYNFNKCSTIGGNPISRRKSLHLFNACFFVVKSNAMIFVVYLNSFRLFNVRKSNILKLSLHSSSRSLICRSTVPSGSFPFRSFLVLCREFDLVQPALIFGDL